MSSIEDIFNLNGNVSSIIQFDLLQNIILEFIKRQKELSIKVENIEERINNNNYTQINNNKEFNNEKLNKKNENEIFPYNEKDDLNIDNYNNIIKNQNEKDQIYKTSLNFDSNKKKDLSNGTEEIISSFNLRLDNIEMSLKEILNKTNSNDLKLENKIEEINKNYNFDKEMNTNLFSTMKERIDDLMIKVQDFNLYDILKNSGNSNIDVAAGLVQNLELKIKKKFELIDEKNKLNDEIIIKTKNDLINMKNASESSFNLSSFNKENLEKFINEYKEEINEIMKKIDETNEKMKKVLKNNIEEKVNNLEKIIKEQNIQLLENQNETLKKSSSNIINSISQEKLSNAIDSLKNLIYKQIGDSENYIKNIIKNLEVEEIKKDISTMKIDLLGKLNKNDLKQLLLKIEENENKILGINDQISQIKTSIDIVNETNNKLVKKVEWLNAAYVSFKPDDLVNKDKIKKNLEFDFSKYITHNQLNQELIKIADEISKMKNEENEIRKYAEQIENRFQYFASENDLKNLEQCLLNSLEEYKLASLKKFSEKTEIQKQLKYLEMEIKHIAESYLLKENNENWLIAKKPMNNYHCASCDSYIGELSSKNEFSAWNKLIPHEDNKYRMGHGFSRMLQLVNADLLKSAEGIKNNISGDDDDNFKKKLPRITSQSNFRNSSQGKSDDKELNLGNISWDNSQGPKLMKIYRKNKGEK